MHQIFKKKIIFVGGKGGVGKSTVSEALAIRLSQAKRRVLWITIEDPLLESGTKLERTPFLTTLNLNPDVAFEEYVGLKIPMAGVAKFFYSNKLIKYLSKAAPGIHELVIAGKVWHERSFYDHVVVDMLSTGYGLAMFQATQNFAKLFRGSPLQKDASAMLETFGDPEQTEFWIVALPEEMPLQEALEYRDHLARYFPNNKPTFLANRCFEALDETLASSPEADPDSFLPITPLARDFAKQRFLLEKYNLQLWKNFSFFKIPFYKDQPVFQAAQTLTQVLGGAPGVSP